MEERKIVRFEPIIKIDKDTNNYNYYKSFLKYLNKTQDIPKIVIIL
jgi:hypothetical protein